MVPGGQGPNRTARLVGPHGHTGRGTQAARSQSFSSDAARDTASSVIALLAGAFMLARAAHDTAPVLAAARASAAIVRDALGSVP